MSYSCEEADDYHDLVDDYQTKNRRNPPLRHQSSSFVRVCDLNLPDMKELCVSIPPWKQHDSAEPKGKWMGLDVMASSPRTDAPQRSPYAPLVLESLVQAGLQAISNKCMWTPVGSTAKLAKERQRRLQSNNGQPRGDEGTAKDTTVLVWSGSFTHGAYGHELPVVKCSGFVAMSADYLVHLLIDSNRVHSYNKNSTGRKDLVILDNTLHSSNKENAGAMTKITKSYAKLSFIPMTMEFLSLLHVRKLKPEDGFGEGYIVVSRAVDQDSRNSTKEGTVVRSEVLLNVHLITKIPGMEDKKCEMTNINHLKSPLIPSFFAAKICLSAATSFINDIRALCK